MDYALIKELEGKCLAKSTSRRPVYFSHGEGNKLFDVTDREYTDFAYGDENCLGYCFKELTWAATEQLGRLINAPFCHDVYPLAVNGLLSEESCFLKGAITNSAVEANQLAIEIAKSHHAENGFNKDKIIYVSGQMLNNFALLKKELDKNTAAVVIQPVCDAVNFAEYDYLVNAYALAKSMDILFICDETNVGQGRLGKRFVYESYGIQPDIVTLGRGMAGGMAAGAVLVKGALKGKAEEQQIACALTCRAVNVVNDFLNADKLESIGKIGDYFIGKLFKFSKHNFIINIRGKGLLAAIELSGRITGARIVGQMEKAGYLIGLTNGNVLKFCPPLTITQEEVDGMINALSEIFASTNI